MGADYRYLGDYSIKFQDCHSVTEWNGDDNTDGVGDGDDDTGNRVLSRRLLWFRSCPTSACAHNVATGCMIPYLKVWWPCRGYQHIVRVLLSHGAGWREWWHRRVCIARKSAKTTTAQATVQLNAFKPTITFPSSMMQVAPWILPIDYAMCGAFDNYYSILDPTALMTVSPSIWVCSPKILAPPLFPVTNHASTRLMDTIFHMPVHPWYPTNASPVLTGRLIMAMVKTRLVRIACTSIATLASARRKCTLIILMSRHVLMFKDWNSLERMEW